MDKLDRTIAGHQKNLDFTMYTTKKFLAHLLKLSYTTYAMLVRMEWEHVPTFVWLATEDKYTCHFCLKNLK